VRHEINNQGGGFSTTDSKPVQRKKKKKRGGDARRKFRDTALEAPQTNTWTTICHVMKPEHMDMKKLLPRGVKGGQSWRVKNFEKEGSDSQWVTLIMSWQEGNKPTRWTSIDQLRV